MDQVWIFEHMSRDPERFTVGFVGAGQMASAVARGMVDAGMVAAEQVSAADPSPRALAAFQQRVPGCRLLDSNAEAIAGSRLAILAIKPQSLPLLEPIPVPAGCCLVSVVAGVTIERLEQVFGTPRVVRAMPNTPALVGAGATAWAAGSRVTSEDRMLVQQMLGALGVALEVEEKQLDAVTGLSGSGPAWVFRFVEALIEAGVDCGLMRQDARQLAVQTVLGAARLLASSDEHPRALADRVTSPGGTTARGLRELDERGFSAAVSAAVRAAAARSAELGRPGSPNGVASRPLPPAQSS